LTSKNILKYLFISGVLICAGFALADSLGAFNQKPYKAVSHGSHNHYVPFDRDPAVPLSDFPTEEPGPNERITAQGKIIKKSTN